MFVHILEIVFRLILGVFGSVGCCHAHLAVIEVDLIVGINQPHIVGLMSVGIGENHVEISLVREHDVIQHLNGELGEFDHLFADLDDLLLFFLGDTLAHTSGQSGNRMDFLAADDLDDPLTTGALCDDLLAGIEADFGDHTEDIAFGLAGHRDRRRSPVRRARKNASYDRRQRTRCTPTRAVCAPPMESSHRRRHRRL